MSCNHLLSASVPSLGKKAAGLVNQGLERSRDFCVPRGTLATKTPAGAVFCSEQRVCEP